MVNWEKDFPNLNNNNRETLKLRFEKARSKPQRNSVLKNARELDINKSLRRMGANAQGVVRFTNNTLPEARAKVAASAMRKKVVNVVKAKMPTREQMLDLGWRLGQDVYDNRRGVEMFAELILLFFTVTGEVSTRINKVVGVALSPLDVTKEGIASRFARLYLTKSKNIGEIVKANAWLNSSQGTSILAIEFSMLLTVGIILRLIFIGNSKAAKKISRILDVIVSTAKLPGFTGSKMLLSIVSFIITFHAQILAAKGIDVSVDKYMADWIKLPIKTMLRWTKNKFLKQELVAFVFSKPMQLLLGAIADMRYVPKSGVGKATRQIKVYVNQMRAREPTLSIAPPGRNNRTPNASRNNGEQVAESPGRPARRTATVTGEGVSPMRIRARGNNNRTYSFSQSMWNSMNRNEMPSTSRDPAVRLTYNNQVRYARRSEL